MTRPTHAGEWEWRPKCLFYAGVTYDGLWMSVLVTETPAAGRLCAELRMGGSAQCGLPDWSGEWREFKEHPLFKEHAESAAFTMLQELDSETGRLVPFAIV